jgi:hypothetical protein
MQDAVGHPHPYYILQYQQIRVKAEGLGDG